MIEIIVLTYLFLIYFSFYYLQSHQWVLEVHAHAQSERLIMIILVFQIYLIIIFSLQIQFSTK